MAARRAATRRKPRSTRPAVGWTLLSTGLLVVVGFGVGLLVGALWETPERVLAPFRGEAQELPLAHLASPGGTTADPDGERRPGTDAAAAPVVVPTVHRPKPPPVAAPPPETGPFSIQVGSFTEPVPAWKLAERLGEKRYPVYVDEGDAAGKTRWRVRVGPVESRDEADGLAARLKSQEGLPTWVLHEEGRG